MGVAGQGEELPGAGPLASSRKKGRKKRTKILVRPWTRVGNHPKKMRFQERENPAPPPLANVAYWFPKCLAAATAAFAEVERLLRSGPAAQAVLKEELGACGSLAHTEDQGELLGALQALVGGTVQYDGQAGAPLSVRQLCGLLLGDSSNRSHSTPYLGLRRAVQVTYPGAHSNQGLGDQGCVHVG